MDKSFAIRTYGYGELALLYFPKSSKQSASVQLRRWILRNNKLEKELIDAGFKPRQKVLTPKQVEIVVKTIGEP